MRTLAGIVFACIVLAGFAASAEEQDYLSVNAGYFDVLRREDPTALFGMEYRFDAFKYGLRPMIGGFVASEGNMYGYAGLDWNIPIWKDQLFIVPNFAPGFYRAGNGKSLGGPVVFRTGFEIDYQFSNAQRLGLAFNHMSNARLYRHNPSDENALIIYSIPMGGSGHWLGF